MCKVAPRGRARLSAIGAAIARVSFGGTHGGLGAVFGPKDDGFSPLGKAGVSDISVEEFDSQFGKNSTATGLQKNKKWEALRGRRVKWDRQALFNCSAAIEHLERYEATPSIGFLPEGVMQSRPVKSPSPAPSLPDPQTIPSTRLMSLDALRGFDMFWIIGGDHLLRALATLSGSPTFRTLAYRHTGHPSWNGFSFYDLIFPLFMFIAGVAIPFSFASHLRGAKPARLHLRIICRGILLILLGLVINGTLSFNFTLHFAQDASGQRHLVSDFSSVRFPSVLGRIGLGYLFAALIVLHTRPRNQLLTAIGLLVGYWAA